MLRVPLFMLVLATGACGTDVRPPVGLVDSEPTFEAIRSDIFVTSCGFGSCHGGTKPAARLDLRSDNVCGALVGHASCLFPTKMLVVPGKPELSFLLDKLEGTGLTGTPQPGCAESNEPMPFGAPRLEPDKIARIEAWIRDGARCDRTGDYGDMPPDAGSTTDAPVATIDAAATTIRAGEHTRITITLALPAPAGGQTIDLDVADPTVLGVPSAYHVEAGLSSIDLDVIGKRPAHATQITASAGSTSRSVAIAVTGLQLSEIHFDPVSADDGAEWVKLANTSDVAIDLSAYSLGSGRTSYTYSMAQLAGMIPAHGCFVVGGPLSATANGSPVYGQTYNFSPDLVNGSGTTGQAAGFALFDAPITQLSPSTIPLDAVLCGQNNLAGLTDSNGNAAPPRCPDVAAGHSVSRTTATTWVDQPTPTPNTCSPQ